MSTNDWDSELALERHEGEGATPAIAGQTKPYMCRVLNNLVKKRCSDQQSETNMNGVRMSMVRNLLSKKVDVVIGMANTRTD